MGQQGHTDIAVGDLRRQDLLGTVATYRVTALLGELVEVEVIEAPGIEPGFRARLLADAVAAMEVLDPALLPVDERPLAEVIQLPRRTQARTQSA